MNFHGGYYGGYFKKTDEKERFHDSFFDFLLFFRGNWSRGIAEHSEIHFRGPMALVRNPVKLYPQNWTLVKGGVPISQTLEKGAFPW